MIERKIKMYTNSTQARTHRNHRHDFIHHGTSARASSAAQRRARRRRGRARRRLNPRALGAAHHPSAVPHRRSERGEIFVLDHRAEQALQRCTLRVCNASRRNVLCALLSESDQLPRVAVHPLEDDVEDAREERAIILPDGVLHVRVLHDTTRGVRQRSELPASLVQEGVNLILPRALQKLTEYGRRRGEIHGASRRQ